ncbi:hypothetical protein JTB14_033186 [Gonioctena quinquepunctata]|nr:hypothetical protein JTB14_033186 [Gonioctena quinquepunctata]
MPYITKSLTVIITLLGSLLEVSSTPGSYRNRFSSHEQHYTKPISLKQGDLRGVVVEVNIGGNERRRVSVFKGIQYAAPPTGNLRFMPPSDAPPWFGIKRAVEFGPVCPQKFPDEKSLSEFTNFFRLKQYLLNESEDCLNLNIYAPYEGKFFIDFKLISFTL